MTPLRSRRALLLACVAIVNGVGAIAGTAEVGDVTDPAIDCGPAALWALGSVEGHAIDFDMLAARLPQRREGHSMKELRDVARSYGLNLEGIYVGKQISLIDRPMLVFIKDKDAKIEHFLVVRPGRSHGVACSVDRLERPTSGYREGRLGGLIPMDGGGFGGEADEMGRCRWVGSRGHVRFVFRGTLILAVFRFQISQRLVTSWLC